MDKNLHFSKIFIRTFKRIGTNFRTLALFEILYTVIAGIILGVVIRLTTIFAQKAAGLNYVGNDNLFSYLRSPVTWLCFLVLLLTVAYLQMIQISGMIRLFEASGQNRKITLKKTVS